MCDVQLVWLYFIFWNGDKRESDLVWMRWSKHIRFCDPSLFRSRVWSVARCSQTSRHHPRSVDWSRGRVSTVDVVHVACDSMLLMGCFSLALSVSVSLSPCSRSLCLDVVMIEREIGGSAGIHPTKTWLPLNRPFLSSSYELKWPADTVHDLHYSLLFKSERICKVSWSTFDVFVPFSDFNRHCLHNAWL